MTATFSNSIAQQRKQVILVIVLALIPFLTFGHIRSHFSWLVGFLWYSLVYIGLGLLQHRISLKAILYHSLVLVPLLIYPFFLYSEGNSFYYPAITPFILIAGGTGYLAGYLLPDKRLVGTLLLILTGVLDVYWCLELLPKLIPNMYQ